MPNSNVTPDSFQRECGGWLAVSPAGARFKIGAIGITQQDAIERFASAWRSWESSDPAQTHPAHEDVTSTKIVGVLAT